jgi:hypothetical protein
MDDATSTVRVTRYYKTVTSRNPETQLPETYRIYLGWGIGLVDSGEGLYTYGSPYQLFSQDVYGSPVADSRVLVKSEELPFSQLTGSDRAVGSDTVHFVNPNI